MTEPGGMRSKIRDPTPGVRVLSLVRMPRSLPGPIRLLWISRKVLITGLLGKTLSKEITMSFAVTVAPPAPALTNTTPWETVVEAYLDAVIDSAHTRRAYERHLLNAFVVFGVAPSAS